MDKNTTHLPSLDEMILRLKGLRPAEEIIERHNTAEARANRRHHDAITRANEDLEDELQAAQERFESELTQYWQESIQGLKDF